MKKLVQTEIPFAAITKSELVKLCEQKRLKTYIQPNRIGISFGQRSVAHWFGFDSSGRLTSFLHSVSAKKGTAQSGEQHSKLVIQKLEKKLGISLFDFRTVKTATPESSPVATEPTGGKASPGNGSESLFSKPNEVDFLVTFKGIRNGLFEVSKGLFGCAELLRKLVELESVKHGIYVDESQVMKLPTDKPDSKINKL